MGLTKNDLSDTICDRLPTSEREPYGAVAFPVAVDSHGKVSFDYFKAFPEVPYGGEVIACT